MEKRVKLHGEKKKFISKAYHIIKYKKGRVCEQSTDRVEPTKEKKKPSLSIPVGKSLHYNYPVYCSDKNSSISREVTLYMKKCIAEDKIPEEDLEEPKKEKFIISVEKSIIDNFKKLCDKYKESGKLNYYATPPSKYIERKMKKHETRNKKI